ncbi:5-formyltetrahydrofolate cyclo-ligase [Alphaproteobacteria bacterium GH1-50]|uniref:5-formyltetrahydrofolate cyclo-ligase n=1 Tax=Kangsaoukella pontilimi TaxID=2691042 RepID=A0A7C9IR05_9RHOB|nr:5-formyltetrahydrofolate cyclo-ligase [Kangsaoukella pontilimi]MXQ06505.1 5-formyltetrahydrofolate cyclo-ligase [Kangsaoukella pontilimi]
MTDKTALRAEARARRAAAHGTVDPAPALAQLLAEIDATTGPVSFFWPIRTEIDPRPVMEGLARRRDVCLPVTTGYAPLAFRRWQPGAAMEVDGFGVAIPAVDDPVTPEVLVVPMLAFDDAGHRLGYGAGHYDRTLAKLRPSGPVTAIGLAYEAQWTERLPAEPTDQPLDAIVTEARIRRFGA